MEHSPDPDYILRGFDGPVCSLSFISIGCSVNTVSYLVAGTQTGSVYLWNLRSRRVVQCLRSLHSGSVLSITALNDIKGPQLLTQGRDGVVYHWSLNDLNSWQKLGSFACSDLGFSPLSTFSMGGHRVVAVTTSQTSQVNIVSIETGQVITSFTGDQQQLGMVMDLKAADSGFVTVGYENGSVARWDVKKPTTVQLCERLHDEAIASFDYSELTRRGVSASVDGSVRAWNADSLQVSANGLSVSAGVGCVKCRQCDGKLFLVGGCDGQLYVYAGNNKLSTLAISRAHSQSIQCLTFNELDKRFAAGSRDRTVSVWSLYKDN